MKFIKTQLLQHYFWPVEKKGYSILSLKFKIKNYSFSFRQIKHVTKNLRESESTTYLYFFLAKIA